MYQNIVNLILKFGSLGISPFAQRINTVQYGLMSYMQYTLISTLYINILDKKKRQKLVQVNSNTVRNV